MTWSLLAGSIQLFLSILNKIQTSSWSLWIPNLCHLHEFRIIIRLPCAYPNVYIQVLWCQQFSDVYPLIKLSLFKTPKVWETLFTTWTESTFKGLWNTVWAKIFYFNAHRQVDVQLMKLLYEHCRQTDILGSSACLALSVITLVAPSSFY